MDLSVIDRIQGLIDQYSAGASRLAVLSQAQYWQDTGFFTPDEADSVTAALNAQDASQTRIDLRALLEASGGQQPEN